MFAPHTVEPIGVIHSPYREKFAIPRQPGLVPSAKATLELLPPYNHIDCVRGLEAFSHIWLSFIFHQTAAQGWKPLVRPPRLGGNAKTGVFATRSTFRPNALGLSVVALDGIESRGQGVVLQLSGIDLLDKTPVVDIKPYLPYADSIPHAKAAFAQQEPAASLSVSFSPAVERQLDRYRDSYPQLRKLICEVLAQDPRPAYQKNRCADRIYGVQLFSFNIQWQVEDQHCTVMAITPID